MLRLVAMFQGRVQQFPLTAGTTSTIGSSHENDFVIAFPGVSRRHATVTPAGDKAILSDVGSKNRLMFRGQRRDSIELFPGDMVQIGRARLLLEHISSSDAQLAVVIDGSSSSAGLSGGRSSTGQVDREGGPADALRWAREAERSDPLRRRQLLDWARDIVGAAAFVIGEPQGDDFAIKEISGSVTPDASEPFVLHLAGSEVLLAYLDHPASAWQREFLEYVAMRMFAVSAEAEARPTIDRGLAFPEEMILGDSERMKELLERIRLTINSELHVLLRGESGTGKELFARMIHQSRRPEAPFEALNCAAIPADLLEAEMFGIRGGVATGVEKRAGHFLSAGRGTVFLDEIGDLPLELQGKVLRVLQEREVLPVGSSVPVKIEARVITSTNKNLEQMIQNGQFRADLYYRLQGLQFIIPALRERREDIAGLVVAFAQRIARVAHRRIPGVSKKALDRLLQYDWPGNVRELKNTVERAVLLCRSGGMLESRHFELPQHETDPTSAPPATDLVSVEIEAIQDALRRAKGNKAAAARLLGITRAGLYLKLKRYGIV